MFPSAGIKAGLQLNTVQLRLYLFTKLTLSQSLAVMVIPAPSNTEKKPLINGHASPSHLGTTINNNHAGKQSKSHCLLLLNWLYFSLWIWLQCYFSFCNIFIHLPVVEGYMKTDDRMRLAKERREERERSLGRCKKKRGWFCELRSSKMPAESSWCAGSIQWFLSWHYSLIGY